MASTNDNAELKAVQLILTELTSFTNEQRDRVLRTVVAFFGDRTGAVTIASAAPAPGRVSAPSAAERFFSEDQNLSAKEFLQQKRPETDIERLACLAYYLAHYRDMPIFKTSDLSKLNTEAAQRKLANPAYTASNAVKAGLLAPAAGGSRQLSAPGEWYVQALPDRAAARASLSSIRRRKGRGSSVSRSGKKK